MDLNDGGAGAGAGGEGGGAADYSDVFGGAGGGAAGGAGGGGDAAAAAAAGGGDAGAGGGEGGGAADPDWYGNLSTDPEGESAANRDYAKSKGWKTLDDVVKSYREAERGLRDSGRIKVPGEGASAEETAAFHRAIGVPEKVEDYATPVPMGSDGKPLLGPDGEPVKLNAPLIDRLKGVAHKMGVPKAAFDGFVSDFVQGQMEELGAQDAEQQRLAAAKVKEWGAASPARMQEVNRAISLLSLEREEVLAVRSALGASRAMDVFQKLGAGIGEDVMLDGGGGGGKFTASASEAQADLDRIKADPALAAKAMVPGSAENIRWERNQGIVAAAASRRANGG